MRSFERDNGWGRIDKFEVVDKIPSGYEIWNIPEMKGYEEYLPLCEVFEGTRNVNLDTLKAIKVGSSDANVVRKASMQGFNNLKSTQRYLNNPRNYKKAEIAKRVLSIYEKIS